MRRGRILLAVVLVFGLLLAMSVPAGAVKPSDAEKAQNIGWHEIGGCSSNNVLDATWPGHVNLNTPNGAVTMVINGVITLAPDTEYTVWIREFYDYSGPIVDSALSIGYVALGTFTTDAFGDGGFHYNISDGDLDPLTRRVQVALNYQNGTRYGCTIAATPLWTLITNE